MDPTRQFDQGGQVALLGQEEDIHGRVPALVRHLAGLLSSWALPSRPSVVVVFLYLARPVAVHNCLAGILQDLLVHSSRLGEARTRRCNRRNRLRSHSLLGTGQTAVVEDLGKPLLLLLLRAGQVVVRPCQRRVAELRGMPFFTCVSLSLRFRLCGQRPIITSNRPPVADLVRGELGVVVFRNEKPSVGSRRCVWIWVCSQ